MIITIGDKDRSQQIAIAPDTHIDIEMTSGATYEDVRFIDVNRTATALRGISRTEGMSEYPLKAIKKIKETHPQVVLTQPPARVQYLKR